ncbi:MAG: hypothetical protein JWS12_445 [Candidatus Saccharibacteria bacterium]|nr:hypothetical protein [Candidatus Saccharibacteria bacterium]
MPIKLNPYLNFKDNARGTIRLVCLQINLASTGYAPK